MKTVLAFGTFDILHPGHLFYLAQARRLGDRLVVVVSRDATVRRLKGRPPVFSEHERRSIVSSLSMVDSALLGSVLRHFAVLKKIKPAVICLGYDHPITPQEICEACKGLGINPPAVVRARALRPSRYKSTRIRTRAHLA